MAAEPWSKFFWSDYEADEGLRVCSLAAQGLWMRMLCLMARATPKGELRIAAEPCSVRDLARLVSESEETVGALLDELRRRGVFSTTRAGVIFSRRMRNDALISRKRAESGAKGAAVTNSKYSEKPDLPQQNRGKPSGKNAAPEARSQKPDIPPLPPKYHFEGRTIRLNKADYDQWAEAFPFIPDLTAELESIDLWLGKADEVTRKRWFHAVSRMLERSNKEHAAAAKARSEEEERFNRRFPERELTESDARALMTPEEFNRWTRRKAG